MRAAGSKPGVYPVTGTVEGATGGAGGNGLGNADPVGLLADLPDLLAPLREEMLANLVMIGQTPAPTGREELRVQYMMDRFAESGLPEAGPDEAGNAVGFLPGRVGDRTVLLVAHLDTIVPETVDHNATVLADRIEGPGISDNSLGAAALTMLPTVLQKLNVQLDCNLQLLGSVKSLDRGDHAGLKFFLDHAHRPYDYGICVEGVPLGRLNYFSIGTIRGDISCRVRPVESRSYGSESAIVVLNYIINRILAIETPTRPFTKIRIARVRAGKSYDVDPDKAVLGFEINSHSDEMIGRVTEQIEDIVSEMSARHAVDAELDVFFRRTAGGLRFSHPLIRACVQVMEGLGIEPDQGHSPSELSEFIARDIPAVTLGISEGSKHHDQIDYVMIEPVMRGMAQLVGLLLALDRGDADAPVAT
ncbi:M28 family peptidase [Alienimonas sp. DA493]|uniref:M28 family peptidase n=1 Tax=Alienimonas sp. DA493 TaxID=3373605 RepID=UPI003754853C